MLAASRGLPPCFPRGGWRPSDRRLLHRAIVFPRLIHTARRVRSGTIVLRLARPLQTAVRCTHCDAATASHHERNLVSFRPATSMRREVRRREFIAILGAAAAYPIAAAAQEPGRTYRLAFLVPVDRQSPGIVAFLDELRVNGFVEGQN